MIQIQTIRKFALSLPETIEEPHFEKTSFRVKKKIFVTYDATANRLCVKFSEVDQSIFSVLDKTSIFPVPNLWGKQGWTFIELDKLADEIIIDAVKCAYQTVAPKKLSEQISR